MILPCRQALVQVPQPVHLSGTQTSSLPRILRRRTSFSSGYWTVMRRPEKVSQGQRHALGNADAVTFKLQPCHLPV